MISWNVELTLVQVLDTDSFQLEGYAVFRNSDMRRWRAIPAEDFLARVAALRKLHPSKLDRVGIASMKEAVASAGGGVPPNHNLPRAVEEARLQRGKAGTINPANDDDSFNYTAG